MFYKHLVCFLDRSERFVQLKQVSKSFMSFLSGIVFSVILETYFRKFAMLYVVLFCASLCLFVGRFFFDRKDFCFWKDTLVLFLFGCTCDCYSSLKWSSCLVFGQCLLSMFKIINIDFFHRDVVRIVQVFLADLYTTDRRTTAVRSVVHLTFVMRGYAYIPNVIKTSIMFAVQI